MWEALRKAGFDEKHPPLADAMGPAPVPARTLDPSAKINTKQTGPTVGGIYSSQCEGRPPLPIKCNVGGDWPRRKNEPPDQQHFQHCILGGRGRCVLGRINSAYGTPAEVFSSDLLGEDKQKLKRCVLIETNPLEPCYPKLHGRPASQPAISQPAGQPASRPANSHPSNPLCAGGAARVKASKTFSKGRGNSICSGRSGRCSGRPIFV